MSLATLKEQNRQDHADREAERLQAITAQSAAWYNMAKGESADGNIKVSFQDGAATPASSARGEDSSQRRKDCDSKVEIKGWPSINGFRVLKLAFKKSVSSVSRRSKEAYAWLTKVEEVKPIDSPQRCVQKMNK